MNGGFQSSPKTFQKEQQKERQAGRNTASRSPSAQEMKDGPEKDKTKTGEKAAKKIGTQKGKKEIRSWLKSSRNRVRPCKGLHQIPNHRNQGGIRGQPHR
jgi:hypothetical protein